MTKAPSSLNLRSNLLSAFVVGLTCSLGASGCKKDEEVQYPPQAQGNGGSSAAPAPAPSPAPTTTAPAPAPDAGAPAPTGPGPLDAATQQLLEAAITLRASQDAEQMQPAGTLVGGIVAEGGQVEGAVLFEPNKCYAIIGAGAMTVTELDLQVTAKPSPAFALPGPVLAVDNGTGNTAAIAPCWKNVFPLPLPVTLVVKATKGSGAVAARAYAK